MSSAGYLCRTRPGEDFFVSDSMLTAALNRESIHGPVNVCYACRIETGTEGDYLYATADCWMVRHYPNGGGQQAFVKVNISGTEQWVVDVDDEMPHSVWVALLKVVGAPLDKHVTS